MSFRDIEFPKSFKYASDREHKPFEFYLNVLPHAQEIHFKLGYFSSYALSILAQPLSLFIINGGILKIITCHQLKSEDVELIEFQDEDFKAIDVLISDNPEDLEAVLRKGEKLFKDCLKYLQKHGRLVIQPVFFKKDYGLAHEKVAVFYDGSDYIQIDGSCNLTASGILKNGESFKVSRSWISKEDLDSILIEKEIINSILDGHHEQYKFVPKDQIERIIATKGQSKEADELLEDGKELLKELKEYYKKNRRTFELIEKVESEQESLIVEAKIQPRFPYPEPYEYQKQAYKNWKDSNRRGLFAMATGTGKTLTSLYCLIEEYKNSGTLRSIVVVPGKELVRQWGKEMSDCRFSNVFLWYSENNNLNSDINSIINLREYKVLNIVITYDSFKRQRFLDILGAHLETFTVIFDEAHNMGAGQFMSRIGDLRFNQVIGLSATPLRLWDENNENEFIENFFDTSHPQYTFSYSMESAINNGFLVPYNYHIKFAELTSEEYDEYLKWTRLIMISNEKDKINSTAAINRQRVLDMAVAKQSILLEIVEDLIQSDNYSHTLVYCPKGTRPEEEERLVHQLGTQVADHFEELPLDVNFFLGETEHRKELIEDFTNQDTHMLFAIKCLDEGVNIPVAKNAIFLASGKNYREFVQRRGRVLRKVNDVNFQKDHADLYDIMVLPPLSSFEEHKQTGTKLILSEYRRSFEFSQLAIFDADRFRETFHKLEQYGLTPYYLENKIQNNE